MMKILPEQYLITPEPADFTDLDQFMQRLSELIKAGIRLIYLRSKQINTATYNRLVTAMAYECRLHSAKLILKATSLSSTWPLAQGIHLTSKQLMYCQKRPVPKDFLLLASCHNQEQLQQAALIDVDGVTLSPVLPTKSHPHATPLGWTQFAELAQTVSMPIFALGGMQMHHLALAKNNGAHGIAAISHFWQSASHSD